jgi:hypothetical protein
MDVTNSGAKAFTIMTMNPSECNIYDDVFVLLFRGNERYGNGYLKQKSEDSYRDDGTMFRRLILLFRGIQKLHIAAISYGNKST